MFPPDWELAVAGFSVVAIEVVAVAGAVVAAAAGAEVAVEVGAGAAVGEPALVSGAALEQSQGQEMLRVGRSKRSPIDDDSLESPV